MMKNKKGIGLLVVLGIIFIVAWDALYIVNEKEQVIITRFGDPQGDAITEPGLKFKTPFIEVRSEEHTSELQSRPHLVCRLLLEKKNSLNIGHSVFAPGKRCECTKPFQFPASLAGTTRM